MKTISMNFDEYLEGQNNSYHDGYKAAITHVKTLLITGRGSDDNELILEIDKIIKDRLKLSFNYHGI